MASRKYQDVYTGYRSSSVVRQFLRLFRISLEQVSGLEHQVQRAAVADPHLLMGGERRFRTFPIVNYQ